MNLDAAAMQAAVVMTSYLAGLLVGRVLGSRVRSLLRTRCRDALGR